MTRAIALAAVAAVLTGATQAEAQGRAARMTDATSHGGVVTAGSSNVFIGGLPAARVNDFASCPLVTPPGTPHVGGPIATGAPTVLINGLPAATVGSTVLEAGGPPSQIVAGSATVLIGASAAR